MAFEFSWEEVDRIYRTFTKFDKDKNGSLDVKELLNVLRDEVPTATEEDAKWFLGMVDADGSNSVSFGEYIKGVSEFGKKGKRAMTKESRTFKWNEAEKLYNVFQECDTDKNGFLSLTELNGALLNVDPKVPRTEVTALIRRLDITQSKFISFGEFVKGIAYSQMKITLDKVNPKLGTLSPAKMVDIPIVSTVETKKVVSTFTDKQKSDAMKAFNAVDKDRSGSIDIDELFEVLRLMYPGITNPECNRIYDLVDSNRSGEITYEEFLEGIVQYQWNVEAMKNTASKAPAVAATTSEYEWEIPFSELQIGSMLGEGTFGTVYKGRWRGSVVAVKKLKYEKLNQEVLDEFKKEIRILGMLRHPNVMLYMGSCTKAPNIVMVTEYLDGGSLFDIIHKRKKRFNLDQIIKMIKQIAQGLNYLHLHRPMIIHRDLKTPNLLVDDGWNIKLCDFGLSCIKPSNQGQLSEQVGTPVWMAPELLLNMKYDEKVDVYSYGLIVYEIITGEIPFKDLTFERIILDVGRNGKRPKIPSTVPVPIQQLIQQCWADKPQKRPSFSLICDHIDRVQKNPGA